MASTGVNEGATAAVVPVDRSLYLHHIFMAVANEREWRGRVFSFEPRQRCPGGENVWWRRRRRTSAHQMEAGQSVFASTNNQDWTENFTGNFSFAGGYPNGNYGHLATPKCPTGSYLHLYSHDGGSPQCIACPSGKYNNGKNSMINTYTAAKARMQTVRETQSASFVRLGPLATAKAVATARCAP